MKTLKFLFLIVILSAFAIGSSIAQTTVEKKTVTATYGIRCDGIISDVIQGTFTQHILTHRDKSGNIDWIKYQMEGDDLLSLWTGETFKMTRINKQEGAPPLNMVIEVTYHHNFIGDNGSHYLLMRTFQVDFNVNPPVTTNISETSKCW